MEELLRFNGFLVRREDRFLSASKGSIRVLVRIEGERETIDGSYIEEVRKALEGKDVNRIRAASEELQQAFARVSEAAYQQAAGAAGEQAGTPTGRPGGPEGPSAEGGDEGVIDAEFKESD